MHLFPAGEDRPRFPDVGRIPEGWSSSRIFPQNNLAKTPMRAAGLARSAITSRAGSWRASARMGGAMLLVFDPRWHPSFCPLQEINDVIRPDGPRSCCARSNSWEIVPAGQLAIEVHGKRGRGNLSEVICTF